MRQVEIPHVLAVSVVRVCKSRGPERANFFFDIDKNKFVRKNARSANQSIIRGSMRQSVILIFLLIEL